MTSESTQPPSGLPNPLTDQSPMTVAFNRITSLADTLNDLGIMSDSTTVVWPSPCPLEGVACTGGSCTIGSACMAPPTPSNDHGVQTLPDGTPLRDVLMRWHNPSD